jgi:uncharacterized membrane protein YqhA
MRAFIQGLTVNHPKLWKWVISPLIWALIAACVVLIINFANKMGG